MPASLIHNTDNSVLKSPFSNNIGGFISQYESRGGTKKKTKKTKRVKRTKKSKKSKKTRKSRKQRI